MREKKATIATVKIEKKDKEKRERIKNLKKKKENCSADRQTSKVHFPKFVCFYADANLKLPPSLAAVVVTDAAVTPAPGPAPVPTVLEINILPSLF